MALYLSREWFEQVRSEAAPSLDGHPEVVLRQVVTGGPDGDIRYQVEVRSGRATLVPGSSGDADMTFTSDYRTAVAIARGELSTQAALLEGRIRVSGNPVELSAHQAVLGHLDPVPARVRTETTFP